MSDENQPEHRNPSRNEQFRAKFEALDKLSVEFSSPAPLKKAIPYATIFALYAGGLALLRTADASIWYALMLTFTAIAMGILTFLSTHDCHRHR